MSIIRSLFADKLAVRVYDSRLDMGMNAASCAASAIRRAIDAKGEANVIFAAAPSQNELYTGLCAVSGIEWDKVNAFHMDEYIGLSKEAPQGFGNFLRNGLFNRLPFKNVSYINPEANDPDEECVRYSRLLDEHPVDVVCLGIGENGHVAFNDPGVADFNDSRMVKTVLLDEVCRNQQVNDGCFAALSDVPEKAITLTVPALMRSPVLVCVVPAKTKAWAVRETLCAEIDERIPATAMRRHGCATLFCDFDSASLL